MLEEIVEIFCYMLEKGDNMKEYAALVTIPAECEDDFMEQLEALDSYDIEWWKEVKGD